MWDTFDRIQLIIAILTLWLCFVHSHLMCLLHAQTEGASEVKQLLHDYRSSKGLLAVEEKNPLLWYLDEDEQ
jgi:hypothetical protein